MDGSRREGDVGGGDAVGGDRRLELAEERAGRRLRLDEPAVVEAHLRLREAHRPLLRGGQRGERRQARAVVLEHVPAVEGGAGGELWRCACM